MVIAMAAIMPIANQKPLEVCSIGITLELLMRKMPAMQRGLA